MTVKILNEYQKRTIIARYGVQVAPKEMAKQFDVSVRTIVRVLEEAGVYKHRVKQLKVPASSVVCLTLLKSHGLDDPKKLTEALGTPTLTRNNVQVYLNACSHDTLATLFYTAAMHKVAQTIEAEAKAKLIPAPIYKEQAPLPYAEQLG